MNALNSNAAAALAVTADRLILGALVTSGLIAGAVGLHYNQPGTAFLVGGLLLAPACWRPAACCRVWCWPAA